MGGPALSIENKPSFTSEQIVNASDIQRRWRKIVEPKLEEYPYVLMFSGSEPKATFLTFDKFEELWDKAKEAEELKLKIELLYRMLSNSTGEKPTISLREVISKSDISEKDLMEAPDVEIEAE